MALLACFVAVISFILWVRLGDHREVTAAPAIELRETASAEVGRSYPASPPHAETLRPVRLPDNWDGSRPDYSGYVWYRAELPNAVHGWQRPTVYLPVAAMNGEVWIDTARVGGAGRMTFPLSRHFYTPQLIEIPRALIRADATQSLWVLVAGHPGYRSGLAPVWIGEHDALYPAWRERRFWQTEGNAATIVINLTLAVFVLLIGWRDRAHGAYVWFGFAAVVWALRNLNYWVTHPVIPDLLFAELCVSGAAWFVALFGIFAMRFSEEYQPGYVGPRWFLPAALGYAVVATGYFLHASDYARANAGFLVLAAIGVGITVWGLVRLVRLAIARPTGELVAVACGALTYLLLLLNDYQVGINRSSQGEIFMRQYAALPLFVAITITLARRYMEALQRTRDLASSLQSEVATQRAQLEQSFAQLREAEREQARSQERTRVMGDLHDGLGMHLATALRQSRSAAHTDRLLTETLQDCMDELRIAVDSLDEHERDPLSLLGTLRYRMAPRFESLGMRLDWQVADNLGEPPALDPSAALNLLRLVQEALSNALKHSGASVVTLSLSRPPAGVRVAIADNGCGFDPATVAHGHGIGQMRSRAARLGAVIDWQRTADGMVLSLTLPQVPVTH
ncbi:MAG: hypothetical protein JNL19_14240 [Burkholderiales bacterium]|nr:hypothetical protein [Burkholderiales bacterium]